MVGIAVHAHTPRNISCSSLVQARRRRATTLVAAAANEACAPTAQSTWCVCACGVLSSLFTSCSASDFFRLCSSSPLSLLSVSIVSCRIERSLFETLVCSTVCCYCFHFFKFDLSEYQSVHVIIDIVFGVCVCVSLSCYHTQ